MTYSIFLSEALFFNFEWPSLAAFVFQFLFITTYGTNKQIHVPVLMFVGRLLSMTICTWPSGFTVCKCYLSSMISFTNKTNCLAKSSCVCARQLLKCNAIIIPSIYLDAIYPEARCTRCNVFKILVSGLRQVCVYYPCIPFYFSYR